MIQEQTYKWVQARLREIDSGALSEQDLARLKEIAATDPFVADALEGFKAHPQAGHADHLEAIEEKINVRDRERRRWLIPNLAVTAIAACLLLLVGAYVVIMRMDSDPVERTFVMVEPDSLMTMDSFPEAIAMESGAAASESESSAPGEEITEISAPTSDSESRKIPEQPEQSNRELARKSASQAKSEPVEGISPSAIEIEEKAVATAQKTYLIEGEIVDARTKQPLPFSPYLVGFSNKLSFTDANGRFSFEAPQSSFVMNLKHNGYTERTMLVSADRQVGVIRIALDSADHSLSLSDAGAEYRQLEAYFAFREYIASNAQLMLGTGVTQGGFIVTVDFTVAADGRPQDLHVTSENGQKKHIKEALRLISSGPDWLCAPGEESCLRRYTFYFQ